MLRTTRSILSALALATLAGAAHAQSPVTFTWAPAASPAYWNDPGNWTNNGALGNTFPGDGRSNDIVLIGDDSQASVLNVSVTILSVSMNHGTTLYVGESATERVLTVTAPVGVTIASGCTIDIGHAGQSYAGRLQLEPTGSNTMPINGTLKLSNSNAKVQVNASGVTATLGGTTGTLDNSHSGTVKALAGTAVLGSSLVLTDNSGSNRWVADGSVATLQFNKAISTLSGDFVVANSGVLNFQANITTSGGFNGTCSDVTTGTGVTFTYSGGQCP